MSKVIQTDEKLVRDICLTIFVVFSGVFVFVFMSFFGLALIGILLFLCVHFGNKHIDKVYELKEKYRD